MYAPVTCLVVKRGFLDDFLRTVLYEAALQCLRKHKQAQKFKNASSQGLVRTEFNVVNLASISGVKLIADFEAEGQGRVEVHYLVESRDVDEELLMAVGAGRERGGIEWSATGTTFSDADVKAIVTAPPTQIAA